MRTGIRILIAISIALAAVAPATADDVSTILDDGSPRDEPTHGAITRNPPGLSDAELDARLAFLEERLDGGEKYAKYWQWGWTTGYGLGIVIGTAQAIDEDENKKRTNDIVTAVKGVIGTSRMLFFPHPGRNGADAMREIPGDSREAKLQRLKKGEETLQRVAKRAKQRTNWKSHAGNIALNAAGGAFIFGLGRDKDAGISMGIGISVGTMQILSAPKRGIQDLNDYETKFGMKTASRFNWMLVPTMGGAALRVTF